MSDVSPRLGPCAPWITAQDVLAQQYPDGLEIPLGTAAQMASVASEVLYALSARQFTGACGPVVDRPLARPTDIDTRFGHRGMPNGYMTAGQFGAAWGVANGGLNHYGTTAPPYVELGSYPVIQVQLVKIDGVVIPSNEYKLQDYRTLVRMRPSASQQPTERYGWPVTQILDLPDTEEGTFSVTYLYGTPPPPSGVLAAQTLAQQLALNALGLDNALPQRITTITRQGVTVAVADVEDFLSKGMTGIWTVDLFLRTYNPTGARLRTMVWSPDVGRPRRTPS